VALRWPWLFYLTFGYCSGIPIRAFFGVLKWSGNSRQLQFPTKSGILAFSNHYQNNPGWRFADPGLFYLTPSGYCSGIPIRAFFGVLKWSGNSRQLQFPTKSGILAFSNRYQNNPGWRFADPGLFYLTPSG